MKYHFKNLIFEGGGVKGIAYVGALSVLEETGILQNITRVGGTSAGAIVALLLALNYSLKEIRKILWSMDFKELLDSSWGIFRNFSRLIIQFGWYKGDYFKGWISELIEKKTGSRLTTFKELDNLKLGRQLYLVGTNLSTGYAEIFSYQHTPDMPLAEAVRISMSIPLFFAAARNQRSEVCVDGGILENYPIKLFDRRSYIESFSHSTEYYDAVNHKYRRNITDPYVFNMETIGFRLDSNNEIKVFERIEAPESRKINNFINFISKLVGTMLDSQQNRHLHSDDWQRTIYIDSLGVKTTDFHITESKKNELVSSGRDGTSKYLHWFNNTTEAPANKPNP